MSNTHPQEQTSKYVSPETIATIGGLLFGSDWERPMRNALGVDRKTIANWKQKGAPKKAFKARMVQQLIRLNQATKALHDLIAD